jgi:hypothetical protein
LTVSFVLCAVCPGVQRLSVHSPWGYACRWGSGRRSKNSSKDARVHILRRGRQRFSLETCSVGRRIGGTEMAWHWVVFALFDFRACFAAGLQAAFKEMWHSCQARVPRPPPRRATALPAPSESHGLPSAFVPDPPVGDPPAMAPTRPAFGHHRVLKPLSSAPVHQVTAVVPSDPSPSLSSHLPPADARE